MGFVKSKAGIQFDPEVVKLLEEHFPRLEELASSQIHQMEPLKTNLLIERGAALQRRIRAGWRRSERLIGNQFAQTARDSENRKPTPCCSSVRDPALQ